MKRLTLILLLMCVIWTDISGIAFADGPVLQKYSDSFYDAFDTVTELIGFAENEAAFQSVFQETKQLLQHYHQIFDIYHAYDQLNNLYYVNHHAAAGPVKAEPELIDLLIWTKDKQQELRGRVNIAMGAVLSVWHQYRTDGQAVPEKLLLQEMANHANIDNVVIDTEEETVFFSDPMMTLDLGAVAKGYAVQQVASCLLEKKMPSFILNVGGNVRCGNQPLDGRKTWGIAIQNPGDGISGTPSDYLDVLYLNDTSVVTSGDYQRYYEVDGVRYHHIIDPDTLMPSAFVHAVTVIARDSAYADLLSTELFLMPCEEGMELVESLDGVEAYWVGMDGSIRYTDGLKSVLRSEGASAQKK